MVSGAITDNTFRRGGGVRVESGTFEMTGGQIIRNTAVSGGGVYVDWARASFTMRDGVISANTATESGGGVFLEYTVGGSLPPFLKTGGTITGYNTDQTQGNVVRDVTGNILARRGHAVFRRDNQRRETTAGPRTNMVNGIRGVTDSGWD